MEIIPAVIPKTKDHLIATLEKIAGVAPSVQIDLVDGAFVNGVAASWPWATRTFVDEMYTVFADLALDFELEIDLMVDRPEQYVEELVSASVSRIVIHAGSSEKLDDILAFRNHVKIGLAFQNDATLELLETYGERIDFVQCMGIAHIGEQHHPFDERVLAHITEIHKKYPTLEISVDGGVSKDTLSRLRAAGATRLVAGSAIFGTPYPDRAYAELTSLSLT